jgi:RimJ/RimL family protein N-acetyltransferase
MGMTEIETGRLVLGKPGRRDKQALVSGIGDWEVAKWLSRVPHPYTEEDADDWLRQVGQEDLSFNIFLDSKLVGGVGLTQDSDGRHELGYWLGRRHWGKGFATEASQGLIDYALSNHKLENIKASYMQGNEGSEKVLRKLGFNVIGKGEIYSLSRRESVPCVKLILRNA